MLWAPLLAMPPRERDRFCREVMASLSDLVEGRAPVGLRRRVEAVFEGSAPFRSLCDTLSGTVEMARACGDRPEDVVDEVAFEMCVERVRSRLAGVPRERGRCPTSLP